MTEERFEQLLKEMREEPSATEEVAAARERVLKRLMGSPACAEFRPSLGDYLAGNLTESRRLLVDDHLSRCAACRRAMAEQKGEGQHHINVLTMPAARRRPVLSSRWTRWAAAAALIVGSGYLGRDRLDAALAPSGPRATVVSVSGEAYRLTQGPLEAGATLGEGESVRTGAGSRTVLQLADGSRVEMNQRTELAVKAAWSGQTILLDRGDVIVQAAKQLRGRLRVVTRDSVAAVKGTTFAVSSGAAGSLVSVVEGSVEVSQPGVDRVLTKGQQSATNTALAKVEIRKSVSWSQDSERYYVLLAEIAGIEKQLAETPSTRTEARLLRYLPSGVQIYLAIPNLDGALRQSLGQIDQRARENQVLNEWWTSTQGQEIRSTLDRLQTVTPMLGEEVVFVLAKDSANNSYPLVLAEIDAGRHDALKEAMDRLGDHLPYRIQGDLLILSESAGSLATGVARLGTGASSEFAAEITQRYQRGVSWIAGVDLTSLSEQMRQGVEGRLTGLANARFLFMEQGSGAQRSENGLTLSFQGTRTGLASWLGAPGSAGSTDYISSDAVAVMSASTKSPRQAFDELLASLPDTDGAAKSLQQFESETGVSIGADVASSLGTDFTFAVERPTIPIPGWVAVFEVVKPGVFEDTIRRLTDAYNRQSSKTSQIALAQETVNGRTWTSLKLWAAPAITWTYDRGYLIASMDRALAARAITIRESASSLTRSPNFQQQFPATEGMHHSGFVWFNTNGALADVAGLIPNPLVKNLMSSREPLLLVLDGDTERIHAASRNRLTSMLVDLMLVQKDAPSGPPDSGKALHERRE